LRSTPQRGHKDHRGGSATIGDRHPTEVFQLVNPILAIGQILLSVALIAAILLQARGTGLSGTFGGDSAVYRSRRGIERRLWQFTIVLLALFVLFALAAFIFVK
jgi:preprotein translocase subunit SecG